MAEVFRAVMPGVEGFKRTFVVKRILAPHSQSQKFVDMFIREARIGAMLNHPNIVQVYDFGNVDGTYFLATEYLRGRDVLLMIRRLRAKQQPFPIPIAAYIAQQIAGGLGYAHALTGPDGQSLNIVHRDVSPSNIMCLRQGGVKLLDFGVARATSEDLPEHTEQGTFKRKLAYMAPERVRNEPLDGRSDVYSLGVVLWEMLTCKHLFRGANMVETFTKILEMPVAAPSSVRPDVPASLDAIVLRAMEAVVRETQFHSRMLPNLLGELFGSGLQSSQVALSCLTPELLAETGLAGTGAELGTAGGTGRKSWGVWVAVGIATMLIALVAVLGIWGSAPSKPAISPAPKPAVAPVPVAPTIAPEVAPTAAPIVGAQAAPTVGAQAAPEKPSAPTAPTARRSVATKRPTSQSHRPNRNPIADGLSIDPLAEAATRKHP
jgi:hypothetical protein